MYAEFLKYNTKTNNHIISNKYILGIVFYYLIVLFINYAAFYYKYIISMFILQF